MGDAGKPVSESASSPAFEAVLERMARLPTNWDGYGSPPLAKAALLAARRLLEVLESFSLPPPAIRPVSGGGLHFEWQTTERELEVEILPDGSAAFLAVVREPDNGREVAHEQPLALEQPGIGYELATWLLGH